MLGACRNCLNLNQYCGKISAILTPLTSILGTSRTIRQFSTFSTVKNDENCQKILTLSEKYRIMKEKLDFYGSFPIDAYVINSHLLDKCG